MSREANKLRGRISGISTNFDAVSNTVKTTSLVTRYTHCRPWSMDMRVPNVNLPSFSTISDPQFRPPNRVGRYGLGQKISKDVADKIDLVTARNYVPPSGSLIKNAEKAVTKKKLQHEAARVAEEEAERERVKNHPARNRWRNNGSDP